MAFSKIENQEGPGAPTKQTQALTPKITAIVRDGTRHGGVGIARLHRLLKESNDSDLPSQDTLARLVDRLFTETGDRVFYRVKKRRRGETGQRRGPRGLPKA